MRGGGIARVKFPHLYNPDSLTDPIFVVQAYDLLADRLQRPLQPGRDRHVGQLRCTVGKP